MMRSGRSLSPNGTTSVLLFDQICRLLTQPSAFNLSLPEQFRITAFRYLEGDAYTVPHMTNVENHHFMLSDLFDCIHLVKTIGGSWDQPPEVASLPRRGAAGA